MEGEGREGRGGDGINPSKTNPVYGPATGALCQWLK
jgi:hypothetical protein